MKAKLLLLTFMGGAIGSALRYAITLGFGLDPSPWLWIVNISGSLLLGFLHTNKFFTAESRQAFWATGFAGGFTTLSSLILCTMVPVPANSLLLAEQIGVGVLAYWLGRIVGGERSWPKSW